VTSYKNEGEKTLAGAALLHKHRNTLAGMESLGTNPTSNQNGINSEDGAQTNYFVRGSPLGSAKLPNGNSLAPSVTGQLMSADSFTH
jgi:hypothetical protein